jgi:hypothetical protein
MESMRERHFSRQAPSVEKRAPSRPPSRISNDPGGSSGLPPMLLSWRGPGEHWRASRRHRSWPVRRSPASRSRIPRVGTAARRKRPARARQTERHRHRRATTHRRRRTRDIRTPPAMRRRETAVREKTPTRARVLRIAAVGSAANDANASRRARRRARCAIRHRRLRAASDCGAAPEPSNACLAFPPGKRRRRQAFRCHNRAARAR